MSKSDGKYIGITDICTVLVIGRRTFERHRKGELKIVTSKGEFNIPEPDLKIGNSQRWERSKFHAWLKGITSGDTNPSKPSPQEAARMMALLNPTKFSIVDEEDE